MKMVIVFLIVSLMITSCLPAIKTGNEKISTEKRVEILHEYMAKDADVNDERPYPHVLSEQEVLLRAADYAIEIGALDPSYPVYKEEPALLTAKIETPILVHGPDGEIGFYMLFAVDDTGASLMEAYVQSYVEKGTKDFVNVISGPRPASNKNDAKDGHIITKKEVKALINSQFPNQLISDPMAVTGLFLEGSRHSNIAVFWYFTVAGNERSAAAANEEYIIDSYVQGYKLINGGIANHRAIGSGYHGSPHLQRARMVKLETPLKLYERIDENMRSIQGRDSSETRREEIKYTVVPLN